MLSLPEWYTPRRGYDIRLLRVAPGLDSQPLEIHSYSRKLISEPDYEAISYIRSGFSKRIILNFTNAKVDRAIYECLLELREGRRRPLLWADPFNLGLYGPSEIYYNTRIRPFSYMNASRTHFWVGIPLPEKASKLIKLLQDIREQLGLAYDANSIFDPFRSREKVSIRHLVKMRSLVPSMNKQDWESLETIFSFKFFTRMSVISELVYSRHPFIRFQSTEIAWDQFIAPFDLLAFYYPYYTPDLRAMKVLHIVDFLRERFHFSHSSPLEPHEILLVLKSCYREADDPRDLVISVYTIAEHAESASKDALDGVDYSLSVKELFKMTALRLGSLCFSVSGKSDDLPSWVPDWRVTSNVFRLNHDEATFHASPHKKGGQFSADGDILQCEALLVDVIQQTSGFLPSRRDCDHYNASSGNAVVFDEWFTFANEHSKRNASKDDVFLEYIDTIQARGCNHRWEPTEPESSKFRIEQARKFLNFLQIENSKETLGVKLFFAACLPSHGRKFGVTRSGRFCLVPGDTRNGDCVCIPHGSKVPVIWRRVSDLYVNIGECYVNGLMHGEVELLSEIGYQLFRLA